MPHQSSFAVDVLCVGHASYDLTMTLDHHPGPDEKCSATGLIKCGGGPAANAAVAVARLGGTSAFAGYLGEDSYGIEHFNELLSEKVRTDLVVRGTQPTPLSLIMVKPGGNRTVVNYRVGTPFLQIDQIDFSCCSPKVILCDGHEPLISLPLLESGHNSGIITVLDAGSVHKGTMELLPVIDCLVASHKFAGDFTGEQDIHRALESLYRQTPSVVITLGEKGLLWKCKESEGRQPAFHVEARDTTGAGDTFHGAFALELARGESFAFALAFASAAAALSCKKFGARPSIPMRQEVEVFFKYFKP